MSNLLLHNFCKEKAVRVKQGTTEWDNMRRHMIGGSEISQFCKGNLQTLAKSKLGLQPFFVNSAMRWGSIFENVSRHLMAQIFYTKIYEVGNLPVLYDDDGKVIHGISPDGFGVIKNLSEIVNYFNSLFHKDPQTCPAKSEYICMFEFKSPTKRIITNEVPTTYIKQILSELSAMPFADYCLYVDTSFKLRPIDSRIGIIRGWFAILSKKPETYIGDLTSVHDNIFAKMLDRRTTYEYVIWQPKEFYFDSEDNFESDNLELSSYIKDNNLYYIGYLSWYLEDALIKIIERDDEFPFNMRDKIKKFMVEIDRLRELSIPEQLTECDKF